MNAAEIKDRLEYLRSQIEAESISWGEIAELQDLAWSISPEDVDLLQWAGVEEHPSERIVEEVLHGYIVCALWASTDDQENPLDDQYTADDIADETREAMRDDVARFIRQALTLDVDTIEPEQLGHDFWLTRNGHGAGFWDRGLGELGDKLTTLAHAFGESDLYVGDDGKVYAA